LPRSPRERILMDAGWRFHLEPNVVLKNSVSIVRWRWQNAGDARPTSDAGATENVSGPDWSDAALDQDVFHGRLAGFVAGVGNGNPSDHTPDKASYRKAFNGLAMVVVGAAGHPGAIRVRATSSGLAPAKITLRARRRE
jgi:hypothetical protein